MLVRVLVDTQTALVPAKNPVNAKWAFRRKCKKYADADSLLNDRICREKENPGTSRKDILRYLFNARDPDIERDHSIQEVLEDSGIPVHVGTDTTSMTIAVSLLYLHNPDTLQKALDEVR